VSSNTYFPFIVTKATVFRILVEIMALLWVLMIVKGETPQESLRLPTGQAKLKLNKLSKALLVYALVILISAFLGVNVYWSLFSGNERMEGVIGIWHFILFFFIISSVFDINDFKKILKAEVGISAFYGLLALMIYAGGRIGAVAATQRLSGFTGNPSYLGTFFIFNSLLALYFYFEGLLPIRRPNVIASEVKQSQRLPRSPEGSLAMTIKNLFPRNDSVWWLLIFIFEALLIFISGTRGGMIGFGLGALYIIISLIFSHQAKTYPSLKKLSLFILIGGIVFLGLVFGLKNTNFVQNNFALNRLTSISLKDPTGAARILSAQTAFKSFLEKPLFGWGPENYEAAYLKNFNPEVVKVLPGDFYFDRAHNKIMEVLATTGIFGLLSYLSIFVAAFWILEKNKKKENQFLTSLVFEAILIGYFVQNVFIFDFHESYLMFFLVLGFISQLGSVIARSENNSVIASEAKQSIRLPPATLRSRLKALGSLAMTKEESSYKSAQDFVPELTKGFILIVSFCLILYSLVFWVIKPYFISRDIINTMKLLVNKNYDASYQLFKNTLSQAGQYENIKKDIVIGVENAFANYVTFSDQLKPFTDDLIVESDALLKKEPWNYRLIMNKAQLQLLESANDPSKFKEAEQTAQTLNQVAPYFPQTHLFLAKIYFLENNLEKAKAEAEQVLSLNPQDANAYYLLGMYYSTIKDATQSTEYLIKAVQLGLPLKDKSTILKLASVLAQQQDYETIVKLYLQGIQIDPQDSEMYVHLAAAYGKLRNKEKAIYYAQKAAELNPNLKQAAQNFIELIQTGQWDKISN
jgi:O-antigen ligase/tetratricopeptide (TPR) repeat protein